MEASVPGAAQIESIEAIEANLVVPMTKRMTKTKRTTVMATVMVMLMAATVTLMVSVLMVSVMTSCGGAGAAGGGVNLIFYFCLIFYYLSVGLVF